MGKTNKGQHSKKKTQDKSVEAAKKRKPGELSTFQKTVIIIFVVVFALSTLAGALASVFQSQNTSQTITADDIDASYEGTVADLEAKVEANPEDTESLLSLAQNCSSWGSTLSWFSSSDEDAATRSTELLQRALGYYEQYLALEDSAEARYGKAMCESSLGDSATAMTDLGGLTTEYPDYAAGWLALGSLYEQQGMTEEAATAYQGAIDADPDGEQGVKESAEQYLEALQSSDEEDADAAADTADDDTTADEAGAESPETSE